MRVRSLLILPLPFAVAIACGATETPTDPALPDASTRDDATVTPGGDSSTPVDAAADGSTECATEQQRCAVDFELANVTASAVELRGNFAPGAWDKGVAMTKTGAVWRTSVPIAAGWTVTYKYCLDPAADGSCASWTPDSVRPVVGANKNNEIASVSCTSYSCAAAPTSVRFIAVGDTGKGNAGQYEVGRAMNAKCNKSGCDFVLLLGDNIYDSGADSPTDPVFADKFEKPYAAMNAPFYAVLGNHDYGGGGAGSEFAKGLNEVEYTKYSKKWRMPAAYYRFSKLNTEFFALDTNSQMYGTDAKQKADVKEWIAGSTANWKIAFGHHPYRSNGTHGNAGVYDGNPSFPVFNGVTVKSFFDEAICGKVDLFFSGHDHSLQWLTDTCNGTELVVSGTGASPSSLIGSNPSRFQSTALGFVYVTIEGKSLTAEMIATDGSTKFTRTLTK